MKKDRTKRKFGNRVEENEVEKESSLIEFFKMALVRDDVWKGRR